MNTDFPRILTLLRKEKKLSQKQAADELGVSQALLSHYEKGIRECGLDFVVKVADYYQVSCDYLLGRSADRTGAKITVEDIPDTTQSTEHSQNSLAALNKKLIFNTLHIIYDILEQSGNKPLTTEVSIYLMISIYEMFRTLYSANGKNPQAMFSIQSDMQQATALSLHILTEARTRHLLNEKGIESSVLTPELLTEKYPDLASSLYNLIQIIEKRMTDKKIC